MRNPLVVEPPHGAHHNHACGQGVRGQYRPARPTGDGPGRLRLGAQGGLRSCERNHVAAFAAAREMLQNLGALALRERLLHKSRQQVRIGMLPSLAGLPSIAHDFGKLFHHHSLLTFLRDSYIILSHFPALPCRSLPMPALRGLWPMPALRGLWPMPALRGLWQGGPEIRHPTRRARTPPARTGRRAATQPDTDLISPLSGADDPLVRERRARRILRQSAANIYCQILNIHFQGLFGLPPAHTRFCEPPEDVLA